MAGVRAPVIMDSDHVILSAVQPETVAKPYCNKKIQMILTIEEV